MKTWICDQNKKMRVIVYETCDKINYAPQLLNLMYKWKRSGRLVRKTVSNFYIVNQYRRKALHMLCKRLASESKNNADLIEFVKIIVMPFIDREKLFSTYIYEKLRTYSIAHRAFKRTSKRENRRTYKMGINTSILSKPSMKSCLVDSGQDGKFGMFNDHLELRNHLLRIILGGTGRAKKAIRFKIN
jgi:hypothetical protein